VFYFDSSGVYRSSALDTFDWIEHGFGTMRAHPFCGRRVTTLRQVHSATVLAVDAPEHRTREGDGLITSTPNVPVGVRTADCQPVLLAAPSTRVIAAVHAGWRGTAAGITTAAVQRMAGEPGSLVAVIGPCIRVCCYEVGNEVAERFSRQYVSPGGPGKYMLDLTAATVSQLRSGGVNERNIYVSDLCTCCRTDFHSFRRDKGEGRMLSAIAIRGV
jgi:YfiH family protein